MNTVAPLIFDWATDHWWLAFWLVFWLGAWAFLVMVGLLRLARHLVRAFMVAARGWPPAHLDADGDFRPAEASASGVPAETQL